MIRGKLVKFDRDSVTIELPAKGNKAAKQRTFAADERTQIGFSRQVVEWKNERGEVIRSFGSSTASYDDLKVGEMVVLPSPAMEDGTEMPARYVGILVDEKEGK